MLYLMTFFTHIANHFNHQNHEYQGEVRPGKQVDLGVYSSSSAHFLRILDGGNARKHRSTEFFQVIYGFNRVIQIIEKQSDSNSCGQSGQNSKQDYFHPVGAGRKMG